MTVHSFHSYLPICGDIILLRVLTVHSFHFYFKIASPKDPAPYLQLDTWKQQLEGISFTFHFLVFTQHGYVRTSTCWVFVTHAAI